MVVEKKKEKVIEIQEEIKISQGDCNLILEKGDKIEILKEEYLVLVPSFISNLDNFNYVRCSFNHRKLAGLSGYIKKEITKMSFYGSQNTLKGQFNVSLKDNNGEPVLILLQDIESIANTNAVANGYEVTMKSGAIFIFY